MARKTAKKSARKAPAKEAAKAKTARGAKKAPRSAGAPGSPKPISSGPGPSPEVLGRKLVAEFNRGNGDRVIKGMWSKDVVSIEGGGMAWRGVANVEAKGAAWTAQNEVRGAVAEGPFVGSTGFAIKFRIDVEDRSTQRRTIMEEVGVYTVKNGKIVQEEFMYGSMLPAEGVAPEMPA